ncbi:MAG: hypothetical protein HZB99_03405 [Candidatus Harrisonbacteria bacterium]|nr:hypothetical protein [Candidatus Harrisonbacteria bacterium]
MANIRYVLGVILLLYAAAFVFFIIDCRSAPDSCSGEIYLTGLTILAIIGGLALFKNFAHIGYAIAMILGLLGFVYSWAFYALGSTETNLQPGTLTVIFPSFFLIFGFTFTSSVVGLMKKPAEKLKLEYKKLKKNNF